MPVCSFCGRNGGLPLEGAAKHHMPRRFLSRLAKRRPDPLPKQQCMANISDAVRRKAKMLLDVLRKTPELSKNGSAEK